MTGTEIAQVVTSVATLVGVVGGIVVSLRNGAKTSQIAAKVEEVHKATNGMTEKLAAANLAQGRSEGKADGLQQGRAEGSPNK